MNDKAFSAAVEAGAAQLRKAHPEMSEREAYRQALEMVQRQEGARVPWVDADDNFHTRVLHIQEEIQREQPELSEPEAYRQAFYRARERQRAR